MYVLAVRGCRLALIFAECADIAHMQTLSYKQSIDKPKRISNDAICAHKNTHEFLLGSNNRQTIECRRRPINLKMIIERSVSRIWPTKMFRRKPTKTTTKEKKRIENVQRTNNGKQNNAP